MSSEVRKEKISHLRCSIALCRAGSISLLLHTPLAVPLGELTKFSHHAMVLLEAERETSKHEHQEKGTKLLGLYNDFMKSLFPRRSRLDGQVTVAVTNLWHSPLRSFCH
jgi:hypothetical protein